MVDLLGDSVDNWAASRLAKIIIGRGKGGKAFCAGGDIKREFGRDELGLFSREGGRRETQVDDLSLVLPFPFCFLGS